MDMKQFLGNAAKTIWEWPGVAGVKTWISDDPFNERGMEGRITVTIPGLPPCHFALCNDTLRLYRGDPMDLLYELQALIERELSHGEMVDDTPLDDVVSRMERDSWI